MGDSGGIGRFSIVSALSTQRWTGRVCRVVLKLQSSLVREKKASIDGGGSGVDG